MFKSNIKDTISTIIAILFPLYEPINAWLISNQPFNWKTFVASLLLSVIAYFTGKNPDGTTKTEAQVVQINKKAEETKPAEK